MLLEPWWCERQYIRKRLLQQCVATTVVAMKMGIHNVGERPVMKLALNQTQGLLSVRVVARIDQDGLRGIKQEDVVGRKPATFEKMDASWKVHRCNQYAAFSGKRNSRRVTKVVARDNLKVEVAL
jgi:hypothetical protein